MFATAAHDRNGLRPTAPTLTAAEEVALAARIADGDRDARDRIVEANLGLVHTIARDYRTRGLDMDDLVGEGRLGLLSAAERFDPAYGVRFSTYAAHWIRMAIRQALTDTTPAIRVPAWMVKLLTRWRRAERALASELGRAPGFDEIADAMGLEPGRRDMVARAIRAGRFVADDDGGAWDAAATTEGSDGGPGTDRLEAEDEWEMVRGRMDRLDDRERAILAWRHGLDGEPQTYREIGRRLGVSREWARAIELKALAKLARS